MIDLGLIFAIIGLPIAFCLVAFPEKSGKFITNLIPKSIKQKVQKIGNIEITNKIVPMTILFVALTIVLICVGLSTYWDYLSWLKSPFQKLALPITIYMWLAPFIIIVLWIVFSAVKEANKELKKEKESHDCHCLH